VAISLYDLNTMQRLAKLERRINPQRSIDPAAQEVHGIAFEDLTECETWDQVAPLVGRTLSAASVVIAHNGQGFDLPFVFGELARVGVALPAVKLMDTMLQGRWATPDGALPSLKALAFACGVEYDPSKAHAAMYDVDVMMECVNRQMARGFFSIPEHPYKFVPMASKAKKK